MARIRALTTAVGGSRGRLRDKRLALQAVLDFFARVRYDTHRWHNPLDTIMFRFVDAFAGCGGLSLGLMSAGGQGLFAIERHPDAFTTLHANLIEGPDVAPSYQWPTWLPREAIDVQHLVRAHAADLRAMQGEVDLVCGGPPCQGYSTNGVRNPADPRNHLFREYLRLVRLLRPRAVLLENVPGMNMGFRAAAARGRRAKHVNFAQRLVRALKRQGYRTLTLELDASEFGVPQRRLRFFVIGVRSDDHAVSRLGDFASILENARAQTFAEIGLPARFRPTARQALGDLEIAGTPLDADPEFPAFVRTPYRRPTNRFQHIMRTGSTEPARDRRLPRHSTTVQARFRKLQQLTGGGRAVPQTLRDRLRIRKARTFILAPNLPAGTVTTLPDDMVHYSEPRILTVRECARLQTFPDWFSFRGPYTSGGPARARACPRYTQVGNAVPVMLARVLGAAMDELLSIEATTEIAH